MTDYSTELAAAREFARLGGRIAMGHFGHGAQARQKPDGTWVTEADWAVEAQVRLRVARTFAGHNVLGEEEGLTAAGGGPPVPGSPTWVIDPIDGTNNYMAGIPIWGTLVGLRVDGRSVVGVCHAPALGETYDAAIGLGARCNGEPIAVEPVKHLEGATVVFSSARSFYDAGLGAFFNELVTSCWRSRGFGEFWGHMLVARGAAHVMIEPDLRLWDVAAVEPIVTEAGGRCTGLHGASFSTRGSLLSTNGELHNEVLALVSDTAPGWKEQELSDRADL